MKMKAISLWQPWATAIAIGAKRIETRSWHTSFRGPLAIHAAKRKIDADPHLLRHPVFQKFKDSTLGPPFWMNLFPLGCIVAICDLTDCVRTEVIRDDLSDPERAFGNYDDGRYAWKLANIRRLQYPHPCRGRQQLFDVEITADMLADVEAVA